MDANPYAEKAKILIEASRYHGIPMEALIHLGKVVFEDNDQAVNNFMAGLYRSNGLDSQGIDEYSFPFSVGRYVFNNYVERSDDDRDKEIMRADIVKVLPMFTLYQQQVPIGTVREVILQMRRDENQPIDMYASKNVFTDVFMDIFARCGYVRSETKRRYGCRHVLWQHYPGSSESVADLRSRLNRSGRISYWAERQ